MSNMTNAELEKCYKAAISREQEANRNWSAATKEWIVERNALQATIKEQAEEITKLGNDWAKAGLTWIVERNTLNAEIDRLKAEKYPDDSVNRMATAAATWSLPKNGMFNIYQLSEMRDERVEEYVELAEVMLKAITPTNEDKPVNKIDQEWLRKKIAEGGDEEIEAGVWLKDNNRENG